MTLATGFLSKGYLPDSCFWARCGAALFGAGAILGWFVFSRFNGMYIVFSICIASRNMMKYDMCDICIKMQKTMPLYAPHDIFAITLSLSRHYSLPIFLWERHPLQVALSPLNISNPFCPLHFQHCFFSTSSTTISTYAIPCFLVCKCFPQSTPPTTPS